MKTQHIVALCAAAFLLGDAEAVYRQRARTKRFTKNITRENELLKLKVNALAATVYALTGEHPDITSAAEQMRIDLEFMKLTDQ